ncbi:MAG: sodium/proton antiporter NhaB [Psychrosphaera sp.]|nr:sodium/proton antiporter NhaB [Psychrosphaera sp.]
MQQSMGTAIYKNFLGHAPEWYKMTILAFLVINPILVYVNPYIAGWALVLEFIFTLAMALKCYPLQPGGLLVIQALFLGLTSAEMVQYEIVQNIEVILLLVFMVAGIYFMKGLLLYAFTKIVVRIESKILTSVAFTFSAAFLSAFLDALTVVAVIISVATGFYGVYHKVASGKEHHHIDHDLSSDEHFESPDREDLDNFRGFLRNLLMHAGVGTALGGVMTKVGEPQNLIIAERAGYDFIEFAIRMAPVSIPVFFAGLCVTVFVEKFKIFSYGVEIPVNVRNILANFDKEQDEQRTQRDKMKLLFQGLIAIWLIVALATHMATVGLIGLSVIILATTFTGIIDEHRIGKAFEEALPFTALLCVFFAVVAVIVDQGLFKPVIDWALTFKGPDQIAMFFIANGLLSMISDNVFVGTIYINELTAALHAGIVTRDQYDLLAVAINAGTNLPSVATPNGQAAFLFLLTSAIAPLLRLSYGRMVWMALPYTIVLTIVGLFFSYYALESSTKALYEMDLIEHHPITSEQPVSSKGH